LTKWLFCGTIPAMNKTTAIIATVLVLTNPTNALQTAHAATPHSVQVANPITLTLNQIVTQALPTPALSAPVVQIAIPPAISATPQQLAERLVDAHYGPGQYAAFAKIVQRESTWNPNAINRETGACGLGQANPCSNLTDHSVEGQLNWMIGYIDERYGTPDNAWRAERTQGWY
jgi:hypothetical protein